MASEKFPISRAHVFVAILLCTAAHLRATVSMSYQPLLASTTAPLSLSLQSLDSVTGTVSINGDFSLPTPGPFTFSWGDGSTSTSYFPAQHTYTSTNENYVVSVTASDTSGNQYQAECTVRFVAPVLSSYNFPSYLTVSVPPTLPTLVSTNGYPVPTLSAFSTVSSVYPYTALNQVFSAAATIEYSIVGGDVYELSDAFNEVVLDSDNDLIYTAWYLSPATVATGADTFAQGVEPYWSGIINEMGKNFTLNMPADYRYGGSTDGGGSEIYSEAMGQIMQQVTDFILVTNAASYGIPDDLALEIRDNAYSTFEFITTYAGELMNGTEPFSDWNPGTGTDPTQSTFSFYSYEFFAQTATDGSNYLQCAQNLCFFLRHFNPDWQAQWQQNTDSVSGSRFRATLMVAALSYAVGKDLRPVFEQYGFPIDDAIYAEVTSVGSGALPNLAPTFATYPQNTSAAVGDSASFSATATGIPSPSYQWYFGGHPISGATSNKLILTAIQSADAGSYTVTATNASGSATSAAATLTVTALPPTITSQPQSTSVTVGGTFSLSVTATGIGTLSYQWYMGGASIAEATSPTYSKSNAQTSDGGSYVVVVSNSAGSVSSNAATVTVNPAPPTITSQPQSLTTTAGSNFSLSVTVSGTGPFSYQWSFDGSAIANASAATYSVANTISSDAGTYTVTVSNAGGSVTSSPATVIVNTATAAVPASSGGGGGGAPSWWFEAALIALAIGRWAASRRFAGLNH